MYSLLSSSCAEGIRREVETRRLGATRRRRCPSACAGSMPSRSATKSRLASGITSCSRGFARSSGPSVSAVQMIGVVVAGGHHVDEVQPLRLDRPLRHAHVRLVGGGVLLGQRIGEVRIDQQVPALALHQEAALSQPPEVKSRLAGRAANVGQQSVAGQRRAGSCEPQLLAHQLDALHHVGQLLPRRPARRLAQAAVRREGQPLRRRILQAARARDPPHRPRVSM